MTKMKIKKIIIMKFNVIHYDLENNAILYILYILKLSKLNDLRFGRNTDLYRLKEKYRLSRSNIEHIISTVS